jgi:D-3-phosphoglycerate dehydrogenase
MLGMIRELEPILIRTGWELECPEVVQTLSEERLIEILPQFDGWIIGDDPATRRVFAAGRAGRLRAAVKWGVGVDNVDFAAAKELGIPVKNTPGMFGREVADVAMSYVTALARQTFAIDRGVRDGTWPKPRGTSLASKKVGLVGFGDIGRNFAKRALAAEMEIIAYDPYFAASPDLPTVESALWPARLEECQFLVFCCALTPANRHMLDAEALQRAQFGLYVVNVARGPLIHEAALIAALESGKVAAAALDVMEVEPLPPTSPLRRFAQNIYGSHNGSNTHEAVRATSERAVAILSGFLKP